MEVGAAYRKWKEARGEQVVELSSADPSIEVSRAMVYKSFRKPCTQEGCGGEMVLESVCASCIEGKKGYRAKWTCEECMHRELSKKEMVEWLKELSSSLKE